MEDSKNPEVDERRIEMERRRDEAADVIAERGWRCGGASGAPNWLVSRTLHRSRRSPRSLA
jgi:hypothetical protein